jgi:hypothetical protein
MYSLSITYLILSSNILSIIDEASPSLQAIKISPLSRENFMACFELEGRARAFGARSAVFFRDFITFSLPLHFA